MKAERPQPITNSDMTESYEDAGYKQSNLVKVPITVP